MEEGSKKKRSLSINCETHFPKPNKNDSPPELLAAGDINPPEELPERRDLFMMRDVCIEREIERQKCHLSKLRNLPDNGEKIRVRLKRLEDELVRRKGHLAVVGDGYDKVTQPERQNFTSASDDFKETTPSPLQGSQSDFCALFNKKLDKKRKDKRSENASGSELSRGGRGSRCDTRSNGRQHNVLTSWKSSFQCSTVARKKNLLNDDENGQCSLNNKSTSPNSFTKRQKPFLSLASKDSSNTYVLVDEEGGELETQQAEEVDEGLQDSKVYYPARNDPECVEICLGDMECLAPQAYLSSTIMNFYIRHLQEPTSATERRSTDYHFFNTYFYNKLREAVSKKNKKEGSFSQLRRWWKGINIFQKAYILFPVHEDLHWSLVIICYPDKEDDSGPIILHLDSLGFHSSQSIFDNVKSFLIEEWKHLNKGEVPPGLPISKQIWKNLSRRIEDKRIQVPQQKNEYDCGLFVLYFIERFIVEAPERLKKKDLAMFGRKWFKPKEASNLRRKIKNLLNKEFSKATQDNQE